MNLLFGFSGRIGRLQWWLAQIIVIPLLLVAGVTIFALARSGSDSAEDAIASSGMSGLVVIGAIIALCVWINAASTVKRFHDRNKSGFWFLIVFVPYIGGIWQIVECGFLSGTPGGNNYGPNPGSGGGYDELSAEIDALRTSAEPTQMQTQSRLMPEARHTPAAQQRAPVATRRSVPTGFGRRGVS